MSQVVRDLCQYWGIEGGSEELFGLRFESSDEYVTETSKKSIKVTSALCLTCLCYIMTLFSKLTIQILTLMHQRALCRHFVSKLQVLWKQKLYPIPILLILGRYNSEVVPLSQMPCQRHRRQAEIRGRRSLLERFPGPAVGERGLCRRWPFRQFRRPRDAIGLFEWDSDSSKPVCTVTLWDCSFGNTYKLFCSTYTK